MSNRHRVTWRAYAAGAGIACALLSGGAPAQEYPARPVRMIVPVSAGGGADAIARVISKDLQKAWVHPVIVDNRPGANTNIGTQLAARAPADGYTLLLTYSLVVVQPSLSRQLPYDLVRDLAPIIKLMEAPSVVTARNSLPVSSIKELIALAKQSPGKITYAEGGTGGPSHLSAELFNSLAGVAMLRVPYKGSAPALIDLAGGHVDVSFATIVSTLPLVRSGKLKALGVTSAARSPILPDVPAISETVRDYEYVTWYGLFSRAGTPAGVLSKVHRDVLAIITSNDIRQQFAREGAQVAGAGPAEFSAYVRTELTKWAKVVKDANIPLDDK